MVQNMILKCMKCNTSSLQYLLLHPSLFYLKACYDFASFYLGELGLHRRMERTSSHHMMRYMKALMLWASKKTFSEAFMLMVGP